ncbi:HxlR family transcriptional regulator [Hoeflea marina]|uniref:HxlR family transcriptional regulator n=1 Tax=Hoeflea marina TaxID=274592 RepID=A0A317PML9_9HYPH|nr:helix-turn-helix domain-containing protein [Hoeflea marina]PWW02007.1 HxlR family transcriptional regulator [Hoeflea marina]
MKPIQHTQSSCRPVVEILDRISDKWTVMVVNQLGGRTMRFSELKREIDGISQKMLTTTLRGLEYDGLVTRTVYAVVPPRVEYSLTDLGRELQVPLMELGKWAIDNRDRMLAARDRFTERESTVR